MRALFADPYRRSVALAAALVVAGLAGIAVAWFGASGTVVIPTQVAYAVSGGIGGVALAGTGLALLEVQRRRHAAALERRSLGAFTRELADLAELVARRRLDGAPARGRARRRVLRAR